jgi:molybdopterin synthase catalytic subunit
MRVRLVAFASAAEALGSRQRQLELPDGSSVADLLTVLETSAPAFTDLRERLAVAIDGRLVTSQEGLVDGCEVALLPPVSGGRGARQSHLTRDPIDLGAVIARVSRPSCGAQVTFIGTVRDTSGSKEVTSLTYDAYEPMADAALERICRELGTAGVCIEIVHRLGRVGVGDASVVIAAASPHREAGYEASRNALERIKREVPIWKHEHYADGSAAWREEEPLRPAVPRSSA